MGRLRAILEAAIPPPGGGIPRLMAPRVKKQPDLREPALHMVGEWPPRRTPATPECLATMSLAGLQDLPHARAATPAGPKRKVVYKDPYTGDTRPAEAGDYPTSSSDTTEDSHITPDEIATLRGKVKSIDLGLDGLWGGFSLTAPLRGGPVPQTMWKRRVQAHLDPSYEASTSKDDMLSEYLPLFWNKRSVSWETAHKNVSKWWDQDKVMGLFWDDGWGYMHRAMLYAVQMLHMYADEAIDPSPEKYASYSAAKLRSVIESGDLPLAVTNDQIITTPHGTQYIKIGALGTVQTYISTDVKYVAVTFFDTDAFQTAIQIPTVMRLKAATADYLFWWAHRLHSHYSETGKLDHWWVGLLCARAALAELSQIAGIIVQEYVHVTSDNSFHCVDLAGAAHGCAEYAIQYTFQYGVMALLALPEPRNPSGSTTGHFYPRDDDPDRFNYSSADSFSATRDGVNQVDGDEVVQFAVVLSLLALWPLDVDLWNRVLEGLDYEGSCGGFTISFKESSFWDANRGYEYSFSIPSECSSVGGEAGGGIVTR